VGCRDSRMCGRGGGKGGARETARRSARARATERTRKSDREKDREIERERDKYDEMPIVCMLPHTDTHIHMYMHSCIHTLFADSLHAYTDTQTHRHENRRIETHDVLDASFMYGT